MSKENYKIKLYEYLIKSKKLYQNNSIIYDYADEIYSLICLTIEALETVEQLPKQNYSQVSLNESNYLVQNFFDKFAINLNIKELEKKEILIFDKYKNNKKRTYDGCNYYDENGNKKSIVYSRQNIKDSILITHELTHYINQPNKQRNLISCSLTEILSYSEELIYLNNLYYQFNNQEINKLLLKERNDALIFSCDLYNIFKLIIVYKNYGNLTKESYYKLFKNNYQGAIKDMDSFVYNKDNLNQLTLAFTGYVIGIYSFMEYINDNTFLNKLNALNDAINTKGFQKCLQIIGIEFNQESLNKIKKNLMEYDATIKYLTNKDFQHVLRKINDK